MAFGITVDGFVLKRLEDIAAETTLEWHAEFGEGFDLDARTPEGQIKGILDEQISELWELFQSVYFSYYPDTSEGINLDNAVALTGITRKAATFSMVSSGRARGTLLTAIPLGTVISVSGNSTSRFATNAAAVISNPAIDEIQTISFDLDPDAGKFNIVFPEGTTVDILDTDSIPTVQAAIDTVVGAGNCIVSGAIDDVTGLTLTYAATLGGVNRAEVTISGNTLTSGGPAVVVTPATTTEGDEPTSDLIALTAEVTGPIAAPASSLTVIETPVVGLDSFINELDGELGTNQETDSELKLRRLQELQIAGSATIDAIRADLLALSGVTAVVVFANIKAVEVPAVDEEQAIDFTTVPDSGDWTLDFSGDVTGSLGFVTTAASLQAALEALPSIGVGNVFVTGDFSLGFSIIFQNALGGTNVTNLIVASNTLLTGATPVVASVSVPVLGEAAKPPHSLDIIVEGGDDTEIGVSLLSTVAGGIETIGDILETPTDDQGFQQQLRFSRPLPVSIFVEVDLTVDAALYPADGDDQVEALILAYGNALTIGQNVVVYGSAPSLSCSFDTVPGILDFVIRVSRDAGPPVSDDNLLIADRERADFDSSRITATS